ncbi:MAG TPA: NAD(P)/FAD-dependent oxidoreductase [Nevskia sp.]|nr:NAD(P)/FAD-dependent oxidoreductase [Nevskia sp.]
MTDTVDCVVVGAGVVGLAVARQLARDGRETVIVERHEAFGTETSSRHSEVIHAGIYYPAGSLKAQLCVRGRELLYRYCAAHGVEHRRSGKLIVATQPSQLGELQRIAEAAHRNGVGDLRQIDRAEALRLEPALQCVGALLSPSTGIVDSHGYMLSLLGDAENHGAVLALLSPVTALRPAAGGVEVCIEGEAQPLLRARWVVNCAGLQAPTLAQRIEGFPAAWVPRAWYAKGNYFTLSGRAPFSRLIYPVPEPGGLGVHLTLDLGGQARFGPDVQWVDAPDYSVDPHRADRFYAAIRAYWPQLRDGQLEPGYAGIRPKISGPGEPAADFRIDGPAAHGVPGIVNLFGIESPGLTSSLAIAERVGAIVAGS